MDQHYGFKVEVDLPYQEAVEKITAALKTEGFGVLTEIDVKETLKSKLDVDFRRYVILGACNPPFAWRALEAETEIGLLLPCNVIVYETDDGGSVVSGINPMVAMGMVENPALEGIAGQVSERIERAITSLTKE